VVRIWSNSHNWREIWRVGLKNKTYMNCSTNLIRTKNSLIRTQLLEWTGNYFCFLVKIEFHREKHTVLANANPMSREDTRTHIDWQSEVTVPKWVQFIPQEQEKKQWTSWCKMTSTTLSAFKFSSDLFSAKPMYSITKHFF
jgi:hypothetical protein